MKPIKTILLLTYLGTAQIGNAQWVEQKFIGTTLTHVRFENPQFGRALLQDGTGFYVTNNGGTTWEKTNTKGLSNCLDIKSLFFINKNVAFVSNCGFIMKSTNAGRSFFNNYMGALPRIDFFDSLFIYVVNSEGTFFLSKDKGEKWKEYNTGITSKLNDAHFTDTLNGYVVGDNGVLRKTTNGGKLWRAANSGTDKNLRTVHFFNPNRGWIAGDGGYLAKTSDGGDNFVSSLSGVNVNFYDMAFPDSLHGYVVGSLGAAYHTADAGKTWKKVKTNTFETLLSISCPAVDTCYAVGTGGIILKYTKDNIMNSYEEEKDSKQLLLYPNPSNDMVNVTVPPTEQLLKVKLLNTQGVLLADMGKVVDFSTMAYPAGLYVVEVVTSKGSKRHTLNIVK